MRSGGREIEIKLRVGSRAQLLRRLKRLGARAVSARMHERNVLFDTPQRKFLQKDELIRLRTETLAPPRGRSGGKRGRKVPPGPDRRQAVLLTYKGPAIRAGLGARYKQREEAEVRVSAAGPLHRIFSGLGLAPSFCYEKFRQAFRLPGLAGVVVQLDETPIGDFVELEGSPASIDRAATLLGYAKPDYILKSYGRLYREALRAAPTRFRPAKGRRRSTKREPEGRTSVPGMLFPGGKRSGP